MSGNAVISTPVRTDGPGVQDQRSRGTGPTVLSREDQRSCKTPFLRLQREFSKGDSRKTSALKTARGALFESKTGRRNAKTIRFQ